MLKVSEEFMKELEDMFQKYEKEVNNSNLMENSVKTYLLHSRNFVNWCRGEFKPGAHKNKK